MKDNVVGARQKNIVRPKFRRRRDLKSLNHYIQIIIILLLLCGCVPTSERFTKGNFNFVFQTVQNGKETLGFHSLGAQNSQFLKTTFNLATPRFFSDENLAALEQHVDYLDPSSEAGRIIILDKNGQAKYCSDYDSFIFGIQSFGGRIYYFDKNILFSVEPKDCNSKEQIFDLEKLGWTPNPQHPHIWSFSLAPNEPYIIISSDYIKSNNLVWNLLRINLTTSEVLDYKKFGVNPSISPDGTKVAYFSENGIRIMDIDGKELIQVTNDPAFFPGRPYISAFDWPKPEWSADGSKLIYHKCENYLTISCSDYSDYTIFIYDLATGKEKRILNNGINPSWVIK